MVAQPSPDEHLRQALLKLVAAQHDYVASYQRMQRLEPPEAGLGRAALVDAERRMDEAMREAQRFAPRRM